MSNSYDAIYALTPEENADGITQMQMLGYSPRYKFFLCEHNGEMLYKIRFRKDIIDEDLNHKRGFDVNPTVADWLMFDIDFSTLHPLAQELITADLKSGDDMDDVLLNRAGIMIPQFRGFVNSDVKGFAVIEGVDDDGNSYSRPNIPEITIQ